MANASGRVVEKDREVDGSRSVALCGGDRSGPHRQIPEFRDAESRTIIYTGTLRHFADKFYKDFSTEHANADSGGKNL
jgi:hypothetical protein